MSVFSPVMKGLRWLSGKQVGNALESIPYKDVHDDVMFTEHGATVGFELFLGNTAFSGDYEGIAVAIHELLNHLLPAGSRLRVVYTSENLDASVIERQRENITAQEPQLRQLLMARLDMLDERRLQGNLLQWRCYCILRLDLNKKEPKPPQAVINRLHDLRMICMGVLSQATFASAPLDKNGVRDVVHDYFNPNYRGVELGEYYNNTVFYDPEQMRDDDSLRPPTFKAQVCKDVLQNDDLDRVRFASGKQAKIFVLQSQPAPTTQTGLFNHFEKLGRNFYVIMDFYSHPNEEALQNQLTNYINYAEVVADLSIMKHPPTARRIRNANAFADESQAKGTRIMEMAAAVVVYADSDEEMRERERSAYSALSRVPGNPWMPLSNGAAETYYALAPFSGSDYGPKVVVNAIIAGHFFPIRGPWRGAAKDPDVLLENQYMGLTGLNLMPDSGNYNANATGKTRSGKTFGIQVLMSWFLAKQERSLFIIDRGLGYKWLVEALDGAYFDPSKHTINPFELPPGKFIPSDDDETDIFIILRAMVPNGSPLDAQTEEGLMRQAIRGAYLVYNSDVTGKLPILEDFVRVLESQDEIGDRPLTEDGKKVRTRLADAFGLWVGDNPSAKLFNGHSTMQYHERRVVYFDIDHVLKAKTTSAVAITAIVNLIKKSMMATIDPTFLVADEMEQAIVDSPELSRYMDNFYTTIAKYVAGVIGMGQNLSAFSRSMFNNATYHLAFQGSVEEQKEWLKRHELPTSLLSTTRHAVKQNGQFSRAMVFMDDQGVTEGDLLTFRPSKYDLWALTSNKAEVARRDAATKEAGDLFKAVDQGLL